MNEVTLDWLEQTNKELRQKGIDVNERAKHALRKWRHENAKNLLSIATVDFSRAQNHFEQQLEIIRIYFLTQTNKDRGYIDAKFRGVYYFAGEFWQVVVPFAFGRPRIDAFAYLKMPNEMLEVVKKNKHALRDYLSVFADSFDYAYAIEEAESVCRTEFPRQLFRSADVHLRAAISLLFQYKTSSKAVEEARMAIEIFLKAYISLIAGLTDSQVKRSFGHKLDKLIDECIAQGAAELASLKQRILGLPPIESRYEAPERTFGELWTAYLLTLRSALAVLRPLTGRDCRKAFRLI